MTVEDESLPDVEGMIRTYLRSSTSVSALVSNRVFFRAPADADAGNYPMVIVTRVGGGDDLSEVPLDLAQVQVDVWGKTREEGGSRLAATAVANAVRKALRAIRSRTTVNSGALFGATLIGMAYVPDPTNARPRYALTYQVSALAAA